MPPAARTIDNRNNCNTRVPVLRKSSFVIRGWYLSGAVSETIFLSCPRRVTGQQAHAERVRESFRRRPMQRGRLAKPGPGNMGPVSPGSSAPGTTNHWRADPGIWDLASRRALSTDLGISPHSCPVHASLGPTSLALRCCLLWTASREAGRGAPSPASARLRARRSPRSPAPEWRRSISLSNRRPWHQLSGEAFRSRSGACASAALPVWSTIRSTPSRG